MKTFIFLITLSLSVHAGLSFNQISISTQVINNPLVFSDRLVYLDEGNYLWFNDGTLNGSIQVMLEGEKIKVKDLIKTPNGILFINKSDNNTLWKTDGIEITKVSDAQLSLMGDNFSNVVTSSLIDSGNFLTIEGDTVEIYDIQPLTLNFDANSGLVPSVCAIDSENLIFRAIESESSFTGMYLYQSSQITPLEYNSQPLDANTLEFVVQFGNSCYYRHFDYNNSLVTHYKIDSQGNVSIIENLENQNFDDYFVFNNQLYLLLKGGFGLGELYTLSEGSNIPEEFILSSTAQGIDVTSSWVTDDFLYLYYQSPCVYSKCTPVPPNPFQLLVFNKSMELVNTIKDNRLSNFLLFEADDKDFIVYKQGELYYNNESDELIKVENGIESTDSVKDGVIDIINVIGGNQDNYYVYATNRTSGKNAIYKVSDQAVVSKQLTGLWVSDQWQSQGLSIHTGTRADSSQYIFVSFYIYRDGQPFWLAGSDELNTGQSSQTINLAEYKGQSFLANDPNQDFEQIDFGAMTIEPQSCNGIKVTINPNNEDSTVLDMSRIINTEFANVCAD